MTAVPPNANASRLRLTEVFGLHPIAARVSEARRALAGDAQTPKTKFGVSSLRFMKPRWSMYLWLGGREATRRVPIYNLFNHLQPAPELGWSVRVTRVADFRGQGYTYDSHNGTDFAVAPGTVVVAAAPARVARVSSEFDRGGLKIFLDHGDGLITSSNHLGRAWVSAGQIVKRGEPIGLSGYSGIDGLLTFPIGTPHVHFNVWLNGRYVDPFARANETSLWRTFNHPTPAPIDQASSNIKSEQLPGSGWNPNALDACLEACSDPHTKAQINAAPTAAEQLMAAVFYQNYYPSRFRTRTEFFETPFPRTPRLDLPFSAHEFDGVVFPDEHVQFTFKSAAQQPVG
jgi:murein DD-endopeptidase MepM/ murein hydrolase activator NlpD